MQDFSVPANFTGRHVFVTGCTGYVGKVLLEKLLRCTPDIAQIYVLIRPKTPRRKRGDDGPPLPTMYAQERFDKEILGSAIFDRIKQELKVKGEIFDDYVHEKVTCVSGDISQEELGMDKESLDHFVNNVDVVLHCAASVDFNERIDSAIKMNVFGCLRMIDMAKRCKSMHAFVHISTAYTNCNQIQPASILGSKEPTQVREEIYPLEFNPQEVVDKVMAMSEEELEAFSLKTSLGGIGASWPNTYTFSKCIAENILRDNRGDIPVAIIRPSIIGCAVREPVPGWIDSAMAAGAVYLAIGMGMAKVMPGACDNVASVVPVDFLINTIMTMVPALKRAKKEATARGESQTKLILCHSCSSDMDDKHRWRTVRANLVPYFLENPPKRRIAKPSIALTSEIMGDVAFFMQYKVVHKMIQAAAYMFRTKKLEKLSTDYGILTHRLGILNKSFRHFMIHHWIFECKTSREIVSAVPDSEKELYFDGSTPVNWNRYTELFCYGLTKWVLKDENATTIPAEDKYVDKYGMYAEYEPSPVKRMYYDVEHAVSSATRSVVGAPITEMPNVVAWTAGALVSIPANLGLLTLLMPIAGNPAPQTDPLEDPEAWKTYIQTLTMLQLFIPLMAHFLGAFFGALASTFFAKSKGPLVPLCVAAFCLIGGIANIFMIPGQPMWYIATDLAGYLPAGFAAWKVGRKFLAPPRAVGELKKKDL